MSSKNLGKPSIIGDPYETPAWSVEECIEHVLPDFLDREPQVILEPSVGSGAFTRLLKARYPNAVVHGVEMDPEVKTVPGCDLLVHGNFLSAVPGSGLLPNYDLIIGNPPYQYAMEFVQKAAPLCRHLLFLLRGGFLESDERNHYLRVVNRPTHCYVLPNRPAFVTNKTDSCMYMRLGWSPYRGVRTILSILPSVPRERRRKAKPDRVVYAKRLFE